MAWVAMAMAMMVLTAAGQQVVNVNGRLVLVGGAGVVGGVRPQMTIPAWARPAPAGDLLRLDDGSELHGEIQLMEPGRAVLWKHPLSKTNLAFAFTHLNRLYFSQAVTSETKVDCFLRLANGDEVWGGLQRLDTNEVEILTAFGGVIRAPRSVVRSVDRVSGAFKRVFDGPTRDVNYLVTPPGGWVYRDGAMICGQMGASLNLNFDAGTACLINFDLEWNDYLLMRMVYSTDARLNNSRADSYALTLGVLGGDFRTNSAELTCVRASEPVGSSLGTEVLPDFGGRNLARCSLEIDHANGRVALVVNGRRVREWRGPRDMKGPWTRLMFTDLNSRAGLALRHMQVFTQDAPFSQGGVGVGTNGDEILFVNHDRAVGRIVEVGRDRVVFDVAGRRLEIPMSRVSHLDFARSPGAWEVASPSGLARADLGGGNYLTVALDSWAKEKAVLTSPMLGRIEVAPRTVRELIFGSGSRSPANSTRPVPDDFGGLDE
jgi:hypothetical protein